MSNDGLDDVSHVAGFASSVVQDLEDDTGRIVARAGPSTRSPIITVEDLPLPFRVPCDTDPSIWSVRVKVSVLLPTCTVFTNDGQLGHEADVVLQICRRCLNSSTNQLLTITSAFTRSSIPGYVFIEAYNIGEVRHAVDGFVVVHDKQLHFIALTEYVGLLSQDTLPSSQVEVGQWMRCLVGRYHNDLGYVLGAGEWDAIVVFVPRIPEPRGK